MNDVEENSAHWEEENSNPGAKITTIIKRYFQNICFTLGSNIILCYLKFHFEQKLCGEENQYTTSPFLFFLKKAKPKNKKTLTLIVQ